MNILTMFIILAIGAMIIFLIISMIEKILLSNDT